jgi:hypothetical protein
MYHWSFIAAGSNLNFEADTYGGWQVYGDGVDGARTGIWL